MIRYLDASLIVALLTPEAASEPADAWFAAQPAGSMAISAWVATEISSALSIKVRTGHSRWTPRRGAIGVECDAIRQPVDAGDHRRTF